MNRFHTLRGRIAATVLVTGALVLGGAAAGTTAYAQTPGGGLLGSGATGQTTSGLGAGVFGAQGTTGLPGRGLFKAVFAIFGAVGTQVPVIAAPIIAQGVTDKTITQAEADQLTAWLSGQHPTSKATPATRPSAGEISVLRKVIAAVLGQLARIAAPVLVQEVANGDLTQGEADMITKVLGALAGRLAGAPSAVPAPRTSVLTGTVASGNLLAALESKVASQVKQKTRHRRHKRATTQMTRSLRSR